MADQLQKKRPTSGGGTGTDEDQVITIDPGSTDEMRQKLKDAADRLAKKKVDDALEAARQAQKLARKVRRSCCCC